MSEFSIKRRKYFIRLLSSQLDHHSYVDGFDQFFFSFPLVHTRSLSLFLSFYLTHTHTLFLSHTHSLSLSLSPCISRQKKYHPSPVHKKPSSFFFPSTLTNTHTHTHSRTWLIRNDFVVFVVYCDFFLSFVSPLSKCKVWVNNIL